MKKQVFFSVMAAIALILAVSFSASSQTTKIPKMPLDSMVKNEKPDYNKFVLNFIGEGTLNKPYKISTAADLRRLAELVNAGTEPYSKAGTYYEQTANINLSGVIHTTIGTPARPFKGKYNGAHFTISNLTINNNNSEPTGLFGCIGVGALVKNTRMTAVSILGDSYHLGGMAGINDGTIEYCCISELNINNRKILEGNTGGIAGCNKGIIRNCMVRVTSSKVKGNSMVGGIAGYNDNKGIVENCYSHASVEAEKGTVGGIVGYSSSSGSNYGLVRYCYTVGGRVYTNSSYDPYAACGGIVGAGGKVQTCVALCSEVVVVAKIDGLGRVFGYSSIGANNYASAVMYIHNGNGRVTPSGTTTTKDGDDALPNNYYIANWWKSLGFSTVHWSIENSGFPRLNGFPNLIQ